MTLNDASARQQDAARPEWSTWLSANAGSGKTRVLTDRVARLLLSGVDPARILCLTYTKAAASEMQNRLFARLGAWAMKPEAELRQALLDLGTGAVPDALLAEARRLFARAIETPGGLRIQTIHSFCATLLRRFPLEAGVSPQFTELDDRAARLMRDAVIEELADGPGLDVVRDLAAHFTGEDFAQLTAEIARHAAAFPRGEAGAIAAALFDLPPGTDAPRLIADVLRGGEAELLQDAALILQTGSVNDQRAAGKLAAIALDAPDLATLAALEGVLLHGESKVPGKSYTARLETIATKATQPKLAPLQDRLDALMRRVEVARPLRLALLAAERTAVLHRFAGAFLPRYARRKLLRGALDFDDLIARAIGLLTDPAVAQWVLFRLDGGVDHILVDEAQDTSPDQWRAIELLAQEFTSGQGARDIDRTIFVVGDQKQSIYSFQGADVSAFARMRERFQTGLAAIEAPFQALDLLHSFRSSPAILDLVDRTFPEPLHPALGGPSRHIAFNETMPGRIEIWPPIAPSETPEEEDWADPVDLISGEHHTAVMGRRVADRIAQILRAGTLIPEGKKMRPVHAGDILILVRRRSPLFAEVIRACKAAGLPIAGADRLHLGAEMAVKDITALLAFLALPEDDLALAECLRSPLFNLSEAALYALAQPRKGFLWEALRNDPCHAETVSVLQDLRDNADFLRPFDLIERALTRHDGRRRFLARLGAEAEDGIDELLNQALAYERNDVPSLTGFLTWLQGEDVQVKRQMESGGRKIRVMTVHGAKGLEAPIVILPDTADLRANDRDEIYRLDDTAVWRPASADSPDRIAALRQDRAERAQAESLRLLYVALTRAQSWLIVGAAGQLASQKGEGGKVPAWYDLIHAGATQLGATVAPDGGLTYQFGTWPLAENITDTAENAPITAPPDWLRHPAPAPRMAETPLRPSMLGGAKVLFGEGSPEDGEAARHRGTALHLLLETLPELPQADWPRAAASLIEDPPLCAALLAEASALLTAPHLAAIFAADALTEVSVTAEYERKRLLGTIDRLIVTPDLIRVIDYKSNQIVPRDAAEVPQGILAQMRAYRAAMAQIYPDRQIETAILWTRTGLLMPVT